ncbi:two-component system histidine kinase PnpS [Paenibacillus tarimensis]|uniref:two-component system histidine kinase PnpS n=1 Tax=Paenibacillus tarimensis TaxID=416012 RepID=UPI001F419D3A|nr:ATP-binding protein [Paenibacillus tarimensis]MCF2943063.1 cell wall metabolism sensor histidine kinase WalK [Paenibacillus tarimensis]
MNSFRARLAIIMIVTVGLAVFLSGLFMAKSVERNYLTSKQDNMIREMRLVLDAMEWKQGQPEELFYYYTKEANRIKNITGSRVTFIRGDGTVLGESDEDPRKLLNHASRPEVVEAKRDGIGRDIRKSESVGQNMMYVALALEPGSENSDIIRMAMSIEDVENSIRELWFFLIMGLLVLFIISAVVSYRVALGLTRPLEQITRVAKRIRNSEYQARVTVRKQDEIGELGTAINAMAESLQEHMKQIRQKEGQLESVLDNMINGIVMIDRKGKILLLNRMAEEVLGFSARELVGRHYAEAKQQYELAQIIQEGLVKRQHLHDEITFYFPEERLLEINLVPVFHSVEEFGGVLLVLQDVSAIRRLERMRSEFVANVSHELKTPIAAVKGFAETLLGGAVNDPEVAKSFLQIIYDESERLNRLIGDILELSKVESRRVPLQFSPVELSSFTAKTVELLSAQAASKGITLETEVENDLYLEADEDRLRQIVMNLLANGINYTPEGGKVTMKVEAVSLGKSAPVSDGVESDYDHVRIWITDTGIGIPKKDLPRIFERFYRVDKARSRGSGGTGLGLSIVKHLVDLHKGTITVESTVGVGSTFMIELPVIQQ